MPSSGCRSRYSIYSNSQILQLTGKSKSGLLGNLT